MKYDGIQEGGGLDGVILQSAPSAEKALNLFFIASSNPFLHRSVVDQQPRPAKSVIFPTLLLLCSFICLLRVT